MTAAIARTRTPQRHVPVSIALRSLPLCDTHELQAAAGLAWVRPLLVAPILTVGVLGGGSLLLVGSILGGGALLAVCSSSAISLLRDTRLSNGVSLLLAGRLQRAAVELEHVVASKGAGPRLDRAQACLAMIAWARGDHGTALRWTRARMATLLETGAADDELYLTRSTEALLLALQDEGEQAAKVVQAMGAAPPGRRYQMANAVASLATAFALDDPEGVRSRVDSWEALLSPHAPLLTAWLAWAWARLQEPRRAQRLIDALDESEPMLEHQAPRLADWVRRFDPNTVDYRRV